MHGCRRGAIALVLALIAGLVAPAAAFAAPATTTTTSTTAPKSTKRPTPTTRPAPGATTTTIDPKSVPPPPAFSLPLDLGLQLLAQRDQANKDLASYSAALPGDRVQAKAAQQKWLVLQRRLDKLRGARARRPSTISISRTPQSRAAAVEAYMNSGSSRLDGRDFHARNCK